MKRQFLKLSAALSVAALLSACGGTDDPAPAAGPKDVVQMAIDSSPEFTTLVAAIKAAGLVDTLKGPGPFTVFAPTNAAFAALPAGTLDTLLKPENKATLTKILTYHVVSGKVLKADVVPLVGKPIATVAGATATFIVNADLTITSQKGSKPAAIVKTDVAATNGVIHVIDQVLIPN